MSITQATVTCTGITALATASYGRRVYVKVVNRGTGTAYFGTSSVTTAGFPLTTAATENPFEITLHEDEILYVTSTGAGSVVVLRSGDTT